MKTNSLLVEHLIEQREACLGKMDEMIGEMLFNCGIEPGYNEASWRGARRGIDKLEAQRRKRVLDELKDGLGYSARHFPNQFKE